MKNPIKPSKGIPNKVGPTSINIAREDPISNADIISAREILVAIQSNL